MCCMHSRKKYAEKLVHPLISSRLNYCNVLLITTPKQELSKQMLAQRAATAQYKKTDEKYLINAHKHIKKIGPLHLPTLYISLL